MQYFFNAPIGKL